MNVESLSRLKIVHYEIKISGTNELIVNTIILRNIFPKDIKME